MNKSYYAVEFWSGRNTTTGKPNKLTGCLSIACTLEVFKSLSERDAWIERGEETSGMRGNCRESVTKAEARGLHLGMTVFEFNSMLDLRSS